MIAAVCSLGVSKLATEIVPALQAAGVPSIVLKGPSFAQCHHGGGQAVR